MSQTTLLRAFNRGLISQLALARTDLERTAVSADVMTNWMPRRLGTMMLRPGTQYIGATASNNATKLVPFVYATTDTALIEFTDSLMRVWVDDALVTRGTITSTFTTGGTQSELFPDIADWTTSGTVAAVSATYMGITGDGSTAAHATQEVDVNQASQVHTLNITIERGPVMIRVGSTSGDDDYINETTLDTGAHSLTLTPTGNFFVRFQSVKKYEVLINSITIDSGAVMSLVSPYAAADLGKIRWDQSADVIYLACNGYQQYKIERRSNNSWSLVKYETTDGPFATINTGPITITPSALSGGTAASPVTATASDSLFKTTDVGSLLRLTSSGQTVTVTDIAAENTWTNTIKVTGVASQRIFTMTRADRTDSTITLQRSLTSDTGPWEDVTTYTTNATITYDDTLDNQTAWYRIGVATGDYGTDAIDLTLDYPIGSIDGIGRIISYTSGTVVNLVVLEDFGGTDATDGWYGADWSDRGGYPTAVALVEGRLAWAGRNRVWLSVSDQYESFDDTVIGDSGTIRRTIGSGPVDDVNFMMALKRMVFGTDSTEWYLRSSGDDEPLTPSNSIPKPYSTQGSAEVNPIKLDDSGLYVQRGGSRVMETSIDQISLEFSSADLMVLFPEGGDSPIRRLAVQRQPDTRVHAVRDDGMVAVLVHDHVENITCWMMVETGDGSGTDPSGDNVTATTPNYTDQLVEDVAILPGGDGTDEDQVYYVVNRSVNGGTVRYIEKWAKESEARGGTINKCSDAHVIGTITGGVMTGLTHLEGMEVTVWVNGKDIGVATVASGQITGLSEDGSNACAGISYMARFRSTKLGNLIEKKNVSGLGVIMNDTHYQGLKYGPDFNRLDDLPLIEDGTATAADTVHAHYDEESFSFDGLWNTDSRLCLQAQSPRPVTLLAAIVDTES